MCGICGIYKFDFNEPVDRNLLQNMLDTMCHRGPDGEGLYLKGNLGLGHRRLSIIDLSTGQQPMSNEDGTVWIVYNGETYNYLELKEDLEKKGHRFRTRSDTETIIHLYEEHGERCVEQLRGMFAFAIWDEKRQRLLLARDRLGKKPLYYYLDHERLIFASELKAILQDGTVPRKLDLSALDDYLTYQYIPAPKSIFQDIRKLEAGHTLLHDSRSVHTQRYWHLTFQESNELQEADAAHQLRELLQEAVRIRLVSDVPLGAFLSGGIDSSTVVAWMSLCADRPVKTFSVGFDKEDFSELRYARLIAERFGTDHHEFVVQPDAIELLPRLVSQFDEPFADSSAIPTYYVSKMARQHVTVCLSGDGGDEVFAGYGYYPIMLKLLDRLRKFDVIPYGLRRPIFSTINRLIPEGMRGRYLSRQLSLSFVERYGDIVSYFNPPSKEKLLSPELKAELPPDSRYSLLCRLNDQLSANSPAITHLQYMDLMTYLPNDILVKVDRTSMLNSLETRVPLLDHKLVEFVASLPANYRMRGYEQKYILKQAMRDLLPQETMTRRKMGFVVPLVHWFRNELWDYSRELLLSRRAASRGFFSQAYISELLNRHKNGEGDFSWRIWALLFFEEWCRQFLDAPVPAVSGE